MTVSGDNWTIFANTVVVQNQGQAYTHILRSIMGDNFQHKIKLLPVCPLVVFSVMRNHLSHIVSIHPIDLYTVLINVTDGEILQLPVRVRHVENARALLLPL